MSEFDRLVGELEARLDQLAVSTLERLRERVPGWVLRDRRQPRPDQRVRPRHPAGPAPRLPPRRPAQELPRGRRRRRRAVARVGELETLLNGYRSAQMTLWEAWFCLIEDSSQLDGDRAPRAPHPRLGLLLPLRRPARRLRRRRRPCTSSSSCAATPSSAASTRSGACSRANRSPPPTRPRTRPRPAPPRPLRLGRGRRRGRPPSSPPSSTAASCSSPRSSAAGGAGSAAHAPSSPPRNAYSSASSPRRAPASPSACRPSASTAFAPPTARPSAPAGSPPRRPDLIRYADVAVESLASENQEDARTFVERELGAIGDDSAASRRIRETLAAYFAAEHNAASAAATLGVHQQTVANRLRAAEERLGHPIGSRRVELEVALRLRAALARAES